MSYTITYIRPTLTLSEGQRARRALRPSYTSHKLPVRFVAPLDRLVEGGCAVPVFQRVRRHAVAPVHAPLPMAH